MKTRFVNPHDCQYIQSRVALDDNTVQQYADMLRQEIVFDACKGVFNSVTGVIIIYDGNHRAEAAKREGVFVEVELEDGNAAYAEWLATGANTHHGLKRTPVDIEHAVKTALRHPRAINKSDREIARHCGCDHKTVGKYRKDLEASGERPKMPAITVTRNGTDYQMTIPMPKDTEPSPPPKPLAKASTEMIQDRVKTWLFDVYGYDVETAREKLHAAICAPIQHAEHFHALAAYVEARLNCTRSDIRQACKALLDNTDALRPATVPGVDAQGHTIDRKVIEARCLDCGETFPRPEDRPDLHFCYECGQARLQERERLTEVHQRHGLIPPAKIETDFNDLEVCDFCGEEFPEGDLYQDHDPKTIPNFYICLACARKAVKSLEVTA